MSKKVEVFRSGENEIPEGLAKRLIVPTHIVRGHSLRPYISEELVPTGLDFILLEDLNGFYQRLTENPFGFLSNCHGLYVAKDHMWIPKEHYEKVNDALKREYGIEVRRALLLPQERIDYWTMVHEALHDVFNHLPPEQRARLVQSATSAYDSKDKFIDMLDLTHLNITNFEWDLEETARRMKANKREGRSPLDSFDDFYVFGRLKPKDQLQTVDEFISNFFANDRGKNRWDERHLPHTFRTILREVGYNMDNPPEVKY